MKTPSPTLVPALLTGILLGSTGLQAQTAWIGGVGNWFTAGNWNNGVPSPVAVGFDARIDNGGIAQIQVPGASVRRLTLGAFGGQSGGLQVLAGSLNVTENLHLGESGQGVVTVGTGGTITSNYTRLGRFTGSSGIATVTGAGSTWSTTVDFLVGESGSGTLSVTNGGAVIAGSYFLMANAAGAPTSNATVSGAGSSLTVNGPLMRIGNAGNATLTLDSGGAASAAATEIASLSGSVSSVTITGAGSSFSAGTSFKVGVVGAGTLTLAANGTLTVGGGLQALVVASAAGGSGALNIGSGGVAGVLNASAVQFGAGTGVVNFNHTGTVDFAIPITGVGALSKFGSGTANLTGISTFTRGVTVTGGTLKLSAGGQINNALDSAVASGSMLITGAGSQWTNTATTYIGDTGTGSLRVESGGLLQATTALLVSRFSSGNGTLTVTGAGSTATTPGEFRIADQGTGLLEILDGGVVTSGNGWLARSTVAAAATAHVSGTDSRWSITGFLDVGERGTGTLLVENAGKVVNSGGGYIGTLGGSTGNATVDGVGSIWDSSFFQIGVSGTGSLTVRNGGKAISRLTGTNSVSLGDLATGIGTATVTGAGSLWDNLGSMVIGTNGHGTLNVLAGGLVNAGPNVSIGNNTGAVGIANVTGGGSQINIPGTLTVGGRADNTLGSGGNGTLTIADGGLVVVGATGTPSATSGATRIGWQAGAIGALNVTGLGSTFTSDYFTVVGGAGNGAMTVSNGGYVLTNATGIGTSTGGTGLLTVTGAGSRYDDTESIDLGFFGGGTLAIADNGVVSVVAGTGVVEVGSNISAIPSTLRIGTGAGAGILEAGNVSLIRTISKLEFNHTGSTTFSVPISGAGFVNKLGAGTTTLIAANTFTGNLNVNTGIVELRGAGDLANALPISIAFGAEFQLFNMTTPHAATLANSGRVKFFDTATGGTAAITNLPTSFEAFFVGSTLFTGNSDAQNATIINLGSTGITQKGAATAFEGNATAGFATVFNQPSPTGKSRGEVGSTSFNGPATAGDSHIYNNASTTAVGGGGLTEFGLGSTAGNATITSRGANVAGSAANGGVEFAGLTAGTATFINEGGTINGGFGGTVYFNLGNGGNATFRNLPGTVTGALGGDLHVDGFTTNVAFIPTLGNAIVENLGASTTGARGGTTLFQGNSLAGAATILNARGAGTSGGGKTTFKNTSLAGTATITNEGAQGGNYGLTEFRDTSNAVSATFHNGADLVGGGFGGRAIFFDTSKAGTASFDNEGAKTTNGFGGEVHFGGSSSADASIITNHGKTIGTAYSGAIAYFFEGSKGGTSTIINGGSAFSNTGYFAGGSAQFSGTSNAEQATILNKAATSQTGSGGATFFNGSGLILATAGSATIINEGGLFQLATNGTTTFFGTSTAGAATITNQGGAAAQSYGGGTSFTNNATAGTSTIFVNGAQVAGGYGGSAYFSGTSTAANATIHVGGVAVNNVGRGQVDFSASATAGNATIYIDAGDAAGGSVTFQNTSNGGTARVVLAGSGITAGGLDISLLSSTGMDIGSIEGEGIISLGGKNLSVGGNELSTTFSGLLRDGGFSGQPGGKLTKVGFGTLTLTSANTHTGGTTVNGGLLEVTTGAALGTGPITLNTFGRLNFADGSLAGGNTLSSFPSPTSNGYGGSLSFSGNSSAGTLNVFQYGTTFPSVYTEAETYFTGTSTAADATFTNYGGAGGGSSHGGAIFFLDNSTVGNATITNHGGAVAGAASAFVTLQSTASAGTAHFINLGTATVTSGGFGNGGHVGFTEQTNAANATFTNHGGTASGGSAGGVLFSNTATAGSAIFTNHPGTAPNAPGGRVRFVGSATAGSSLLENRNATQLGALAGYTVFEETSTAGSATITSFGASGPDLNPGLLQFIHQSAAGTATIIAKGGGMHNVYAAGTAGGLVTFRDTAHAGSATFTSEAGTQPGGAGGSVEFYNSTSADNGIFSALAPTLNGGISGGYVEFHDTSTAANGTFATEGAKNFNAYFGATGSVIFYDQSTAANSMLTNLPASAASANGGFTGFSNTATAGSATLINRGGNLSGGQGGDIGFFSSSTAGNSTITLEGGEVAGALGSTLRFNDTSTAGNATIMTLGGIGGGGLTRFYQTSGGGAAAFVTEGNGTFDISYLTSTGTTAGSIAGSGNYLLGAKTLTVGSLNTHTEVSGTISGSGGRLDKFGTATLTLSGANTYTGGTLVGAGKLRISNPGGSATGSGAVIVENTAVLTGAGAVTGSVTIRSGGTISPGDSPGTLTTGSETWNAGGNYLWEINELPGRGSTAAAGASTGWDTLTINGALNLNATTLNKFKLQITSLAAAVTGNAANFNSSLPYRLTLATASAGIFGFTPAAFDLSALAFSNPLHGTTFGIEKIGNSLMLAFNTPTGLTYAIWAAGFPFDPGDAITTADPDHDGVRNLLEYAQAMDPLLPDVELLPRRSVVNVGGLDYQALSYEKVAAPHGPTDLTYAVERSENLSAWSAAGVTAHDISLDALTGLETITVRSGTPLGVTREFLRLSVTKP